MVREGRVLTLAPATVSAIWLSACMPVDDPLVVAARGGDTVAIERILAGGKSADTRSKSNWPILVEAAFGNHTDASLRLLAANASINAANPNGFTALHEAAKRGNLILMSELLKRGAEIDAETQDGWTAVTWAAFMGHSATVELLLEQGANVDPVDKQGNSALTWAVRRKHVEMIRLLALHGANPNRQSGNEAMPSYPLLEAISAPEPDLEILRALLTAGADIEAAGWHNDTPLNRAARMGKVEAARFLVKSGANVNTIGSYYQKTPLMWAAKYGQVDLMNNLLKVGAIIQGRANGKWLDAMEEALNAQEYQALEILARAGADPHYPLDSGISVIETARKSGDQRALKILNH